MKVVSFSFEPDERTAAYAQAALDAERLRNDPADQAEIQAVNEELDEISAW
jgi:hypothetical protein